MPILEDEAGIYGYTEENRYFTEAFRKGEAPFETFADGIEVVRILDGAIPVGRGGTNRPLHRGRAGHLRACRWPVRQSKP